MTTALIGIVMAGVLLGDVQASATSSHTTSPAVSTPSASTAAVPTPSASIVTTANGPIRGQVTQGHAKFLGIPYAAPPVGPLRWQAPHSVRPWRTPRDATAFGPDCAQLTTPFGQASTSEDCLYLNVYPAKRRVGNAPPPVFVWFHGGGFIGGAGRLYDPTRLVDEGLTVVTANYRVGALGFLAARGLQDGRGRSGNYGFQDQQAALRWVQRNIARFGSDPNAVTIAGESAGGLSTVAHLASPASKGLFDRAIVQSGAYKLILPTQSAAERSGANLAASVGCSDQNAACLRHVSASRLLSQQEGEYVPNLERGILPLSPRQAFASGQFNRVPIIDGTNRDEWRLFVANDVLSGKAVTKANYGSRIADTLGVSSTTAQTVVARYPLNRYASPALALAAVGTDAKFACGALRMDQLASRYAPVYAYEFADLTSPENFLPPAGFPYGAAHAVELQYLFGLPNALSKGQLSAAQERLGSSMRGAWSSFTAGDTQRLVRTYGWLRFNPLGQLMRRLVTHGRPLTSTFAERHDCAFWSHLGVDR